MQRLQFTIIITGFKYFTFGLLLEQIAIVISSYIDIVSRKSLLHRFSLFCFSKGIFYLMINTDSLFGLKALERCMDLIKNRATEDSYSSL